MIKKLFALLSITSLLSCSTSTETVNSNIDPHISVFASDIFNDFKLNEVSAKDKYYNKVIEVSGKIASIENYADGYFVLVNDGNSENVGVKAHFNSDQKESVVKLIKGDYVKVKGIGGNDASIDFNLFGCVLISRTTPEAL